MSGSLPEGGCWRLSALTCMDMGFSSLTVTGKLNAGSFVGHAGRHDQDLSAGCFDGVITHGEGELAILDHEDLPVGVLVQHRTFSGWRLVNEKRDVRAAVEITLEPVGVTTVRKFVFVDHVGHSDLLSIHQPRSTSRGYPSCPRTRHQPLHAAGTP